jgi:hypothetical protein
LQGERIVNISFSSIPPPPFQLCHGNEKNKG